MRLEIIPVMSQYSNAKNVRKMARPPPAKSSPKRSCFFGEIAKFASFRSWAEVLVSSISKFYSATVQDAMDDRTI